MQMVPSTSPFIDPAASSNSPADPYRNMTPPSANTLSQRSSAPNPRAIQPEPTSDPAANLPAPRQQHETTAAATHTGRLAATAATAAATKGQNNHSDKTTTATHRTGCSRLSGLVCSQGLLGPLLFASSCCCGLGHGALPARLVNFIALVN